jgi:hypothetical protein
MSTFEVFLDRSQQIALFLTVYRLADALPVVTSAGRGGAQSVSP